MIPLGKLLIVVLSLALSGLQSFADEPFQPELLVQCLQRPQASGLTVLTDVNPFYLRGDFDGDAKPDYAVRVRSRKGGTGLLICAGSRSLYLLGSGIVGGSEFSDMPRDAFLAPHWEVFTPEDVADLRRFRSNVPRPVPTVKGESIAMVWGDGICLIYWTGEKFKWAGSNE